MGTKNPKKKFPCWRRSHFFGVPTSQILRPNVAESPVHGFVWIRLVASSLILVGFYRSNCGAPPCTTCHHRHSWRDRWLCWRCIWLLQKRFQPLPCCRRGRPAMVGIIMITIWLVIVWYWLVVWNIFSIIYGMSSFPSDFFKMVKTTNQDMYLEIA